MQVIMSLFYHIHKLGQHFLNISKTTIDPQILMLKIEYPISYCLYIIVVLIDNQDSDKPIYQNIISNLWPYYIYLVICLKLDRYG